MSIKQQLSAAVQDLPDSVKTIEEAIAQLYRAFKLKQAVSEYHRRSRALEGGTEESPEVLAQRRRTALGQDRGKVWISEDFDAPLPADLQRLFEGGEA